MTTGNQARGAEKDLKDLRESLKILGATLATPDGCIRTSGTQIAQKCFVTDESSCKDLGQKET